MEFYLKYGKISKYRQKLIKNQDKNIKKYLKTDQKSRKILKNWMKI